MLIDVHAHFLHAAGPRADWAERNASRLKAGRKTGITCHVASVLGSWGRTSPTYFPSPADVTAGNDALLSLMGEHGALIRGYACVNPNFTDHIVELSRISPDTIEGRCPDVLREFLEVRGIGILNIRTIFGETAVRPRKLLRLIVNLEDHSNEAFSDLDRLQVNATYQEVLAVPIRKVTIPVAAGRNLAVLVEAAVRNFVLNQRGIDSTKEFIERQQRLMEDGG